MKKIFYCLLVVSSCFFISCSKDGSQNPSNNNNNASEFFGIWIADDVDIMWAREEAESYYWKYQELNDDLHVYQLQANWDKIIQLERQIKNLHEEYRDDYIGTCDVLNIENGIIKIGQAEFYLNPTSSTTCLSYYNAFTQFNMGMKIGLVVKDWETYRFSVQDGVLNFNNGQDCLFFAGSKLVWEGVTDFMSEFDYIPLIVE